jgi:hypothetical protein
MLLFEVILDFNNRQIISLSFIGGNILLNNHNSLGN